MDNLTFLLIIIIIIVISAIYYMDTTTNLTNEKFTTNILSLDPYHRCKILGVNKFMIQDLKTNLWLSDGIEAGFNKFLPGKFGIPLMMSDKPDEYLPLRTVSDPNDYLLATYNGEGIRVVSNPYNKTFILQIFIYNGHNVIGYLNENSTQLYLNIDSNGNITSTDKPSKASIIRVIEI